MGGIAGGCRDRALRGRGCGSAQAGFLRDGGRAEQRTGRGHRTGDLACDPSLGLTGGAGGEVEPRGRGQEGRRGARLAGVGPGKPASPRGGVVRDPEISSLALARSGTGCRPAGAAPVHLREAEAKGRRGAGALAAPRGREEVAVGQGAVGHGAMARLLRTQTGERRSPPAAGRDGRSGASWDPAAGSPQAGRARPPPGSTVRVPRRSGALRKPGRPRGRRPPPCACCGRSLHWGAPAWARGSAARAGVRSRRGGAVGVAPQRRGLGRRTREPEGAGGGSRPVALVRFHTATLYSTFQDCVCPHPGANKCLGRGGVKGEREVGQRRHRGWGGRRGWEVSGESGDSLERAVVGGGAQARCPPKYSQFVRVYCKPGLSPVTDPQESRVVRVLLILPVENWFREIWVRAPGSQGRKGQNGVGSRSLEPQLVLPGFTLSLLYSSLFLFSWKNTFTALIQKNHTWSAQLTKL